ERDRVEALRSTPSQGGRSCWRRLDRVACAGQRMGEPGAVPRIVFDYEDARRARSGGAGSRRRVGLGKGPWSPRQYGEEHAAHPRRAAHPDPSALRLDDPPGEGQPEPGARVLLGRACVELAELHEQLVDVLGANADAGVLHLDAELPGALLPDTDRDAPFLGRELEGVREVVVED